MIKPYHTLLILEMPKGWVYYASWGKSTAGTILPSTKHLAKGKIAPVVLLPHEAK